MLRATSTQKAHSSFSLLSLPIKKGLLLWNVLSNNRRKRNEMNGREVSNVERFKSKANLSHFPSKSFCLCSRDSTKQLHNSPLKCEAIIHGPLFTDRIWRPRERHSIKKGWMGRKVFAYSLSYISHRYNFIFNLNFWDFHFFFPFIRVIIFHTHSDTRKADFFKSFGNDVLCECFTRKSLSTSYTTCKKGQNKLQLKINRYINCFLNPSLAQFQVNGTQNFCGID